MSLIGAHSTFWFFWFKLFWCTKLEIFIKFGGDSEYFFLIDRTADFVNCAGNYNEISIQFRTIIQSRTIKSSEGVQSKEIKLECLFQHGLLVLEIVPAYGNRAIIWMKSRERRVKK